MTNLNSHIIILVLFHWIIKQNYKKTNITGDWSQSTVEPTDHFYRITLRCNCALSVAITAVQYRQNSGATERQHNFCATIK